MKTYLIHFTTTYQCFARIKAESTAAAKTLVEGEIAEYMADGMRNRPVIPDADDGLKELDQYDSGNPPLFSLMQVDEDEDN